MGTRGVAWRRVCPDVVSRQLDAVSRVTLYILHETGPTGFILKEDGARKKIKVLLGDPHTCSCADFKKDRELCPHILWVMLKKFRVPPTNPIIWQLGLVEREINEILRGYLIRQSPTPSKSHTPFSSGQIQIPQREIGPDDVCPICQDDLLSSGRRITYCRFGCGKSVHVKCMKIWSEHQKSADDATLRCPLCREEFGSIINLSETGLSRLAGSDPQQQCQHFGVACSQCEVCPVMGRLYQCCRCENYHLCHSCFSDSRSYHVHPFQFRQHSNQPWRPVLHSSSAPSHLSSSPSHPSPTLLPTLVTSLQSRSLTEADYDLLLALDGNQRSRPPREGVAHTRESAAPRREGVAERAIASLRVEPLDSGHPLIVGGASCHICQRGYVRGDWVKKLPCKHKFHRGCIDAWLFASHTTCPVDNLPILAPRVTNMRSRHAPNQSGQGTARRGRAAGSLARVRPRRGLVDRSHDQHQSPPDLNFAVWGQRIVNEDSTEEGGVHPMKMKHCRTLDATPTNSLTGANINSLLTIGRPCPLPPHPPMEPHISLGPVPSLMSGGQRSYLGLGVINQKTAPIGRLRKGCIGPGGGANRRNKSHGYQRPVSELVGTNLTVTVPNVDLTTPSAHLRHHAQMS